MSLEFRACRKRRIEADFSGGDITSNGGGAGPCPGQPIDAVLGHQAGRFFHGYYDHWCFLPLYVFCGERKGVGYIVGLGKNARLNDLAAPWTETSAAYFRSNEVDTAPRPFPSILRAPSHRVAGRGEAGVV